MRPKNFPARKLRRQQFAAGKAVRQLRQEWKKDNDNACYVSYTTIVSDWAKFANREMTKENTDLRYARGIRTKKYRG